MSDDDKPHVEALLFDGQVDGPRYAKIARKLCDLLEEEGLSEPELIPFLGFYLAHVLDCHLYCDFEMFRRNMREFGLFTISMFGHMKETEHEGEGPRH